MKAEIEWRDDKKKENVSLLSRCSQRKIQKQFSFFGESERLSPFSSFFLSYHSLCSFASSGNALILACFFITFVLFFYILFAITCSVFFFFFFGGGWGGSAWGAPKSVMPSSQV